MKTRSILYALLFCLCATLASFAADNPNLGSWKLNEDKSKIPAGAAKNTGVTYTMEGDSYKCVVEGVGADGQAAHNEWTGKFDGKDYAVTGDPSADMRSIRQTSDDHHYKLTQKKDGKVVGTGTIVLAPDGKSRTVTITTKAGGKKTSSTMTYDKQE